LLIRSRVTLAPANPTAAKSKLRNSVIGYASTPSAARTAIGNHVSNTFAKLRVASRPEAAIRAREAGLGE
jgi:DNA-binding NarL/FixJ family response regulator